MATGGDDKAPAESLIVATVGYTNDEGDAGVGDAAVATGGGNKAPAAGRDGVVEDGIVLTGEDEKAPAGNIVVGHAAVATGGNIND